MYIMKQLYKICLFPLYRLQGFISLFFLTQFVILDTLNSLSTFKSAQSIIYALVLLILGQILLSVLNLKRWIDRFLLALLCLDNVHERRLCVLDTNVPVPSSLPHIWGAGIHYTSWSPSRSRSITMIVQCTLRWLSSNPIPFHGDFYYEPRSIDRNLLPKCSMPSFPSPRIWTRS